ncbi:MAG: Ppx/GppA phosphatase family protein, partial [Myxococcota bacterium]
MIVGRLDNGHLTIVDKMRERVRLGAGLDSQERLTTKARDRALDCLHRFGERVRGMPLGRVRAVGTNTLRKMRESENFLYEARLALGHPVEVIAGQEEARLIYLGVLQSLPERDQQRLVIDIGGGSTECIVGYNEQIKLANSLYMGCVAYSLQFFNDQRLTARAFEQAQLAVRLELQPIVRRYKKRGWDLAVGCSGTIHAIRKIVEANGWSPPGRITRDGLKRVKRALIAAGHIDDLELAGLHEDRRPVIAGGVSILHALFEAFELSEMTPSPGALREGALYDLVGRIQQEDVRDRTISAVQTRHDVDEGQAGRVKGVAIDLWKQIGGDWRIDSPMCRRLLTWAADLHEIGLSISYTGYHKHSAYVV